MTKKIDYYHCWNIMNLSLFFIGWIIIYDSFKYSNLIQADIGIFLTIIISVSIFYQNKLERSLIWSD